MTTTKTTPSVPTGTRRTDDYAVMRYVHQKEPLLYRYELFHIMTGEISISTVTVSETVPVDILREQQRCRHERNRV